MNFEDLEKKVNDLAEQFDEKIEQISKQIDEKVSKMGSSPADDFTHSKHAHHRRETPFWGIVLVIVGFILLGNHLDWFHFSIPIFPAALIVLGIYLIVDNLNK